MVEINNFRFKKKGTQTLLSPLECDVLNVLWKRERMKVRDIYRIVRKRRKVALTSIAVILDRLHKKQIVERTVETGKGGECYIYYPKITKIDFQKSVVEKTVDKLIDTFGPVAVNYFNERFSKEKKI